jgi:pimeloyl-ACP methyl ester carboxylesterase
MGLSSREVSVRDGACSVTVFEGGEGASVLYLHGIWDQPPNDFVEELSRSFHVVAPLHLGFEGSAPATDMLDIHDAVYHHLDLVDALGLDQVALVGHSLGGMFAAELAAVDPRRFTRLVLISPLGLWDPAHPVMDFFSAQPGEVARALFSDAEGAEAAAVTQPPADEDARVAYILRRGRALGTATRYLWPIPSKGLRRRVHRITMPCLVVWGAEDGICPPWYAHQYGVLLRECRVEIVERAAHLVHVERCSAVAEAVSSFLAAPATAASRL